MIKEAIILAGGLGTRLRSVVSDVPKCMAPVNGNPFLYYVLSHLRKEGITDFIFSLGYKSGDIIDYIESSSDQLTIKNYQFSTEKEPLGTGGAIRLALEKTSGENVIIVNGDTLFSIDVNAISNFHLRQDADCTLCLKPMKNFDRYGVVELNSDQSIRSFKEKHFYPSGLINGGVYALNIARFKQETFPEKFSFEKDYLEKFTGKRKFYGIEQDRYFIDIGIPEDYERAQKELLISYGSLVKKSSGKQE
ncbi:MAG TPA: nucleotidyltransferase family protein [Chitinophagaceae bacterium]|nr:nucleotidyltransferase family protein [Chitinophagaceae bacterium]